MLCETVVSTLKNSIKVQHLNKSKLHLNKRSSNILGSTFVSELSRILT